MVFWLLGMMCVDLKKTVNCFRNKERWKTTRMPSSRSVTLDDEVETDSR